MNQAKDENVRAVLTSVTISAIPEPGQNY